MGLITQLCVNVNAKKIVVVVAVVRPVLEALAIAGVVVVATIKKREGVRGRAQRLPRNANQVWTALSPYWVIP